MQFIRQFQSEVGFLMYFMTCTRSDLALSITRVAKYALNFTKEHYYALGRIWRYVKGTKEKLLNFNFSLNYSSYCNSNWEGKFKLRRSTTGYLFTFSGGVIS